MDWLADILQDVVDELGAPSQVGGDTLDEKYHALKVLETTPFVWNGTPRLGIDALQPDEFKAVSSHVFSGGTVVLRRTSVDVHRALIRARREPFRWRGIRFLRLDCMARHEVPELIEGLLRGDEIQFPFDDPDFPPRVQ